MFKEISERENERKKQKKGKILGGKARWVIFSGIECLLSPGTHSRREPREDTYLKSREIPLDDGQAPI